MGVNKGAIKQEVADEKLAAWIEQKEAAITKRREKTIEDKRKFAAKVDGSAKVKVKAAPPLPVIEEHEPAAEAVVETAAEVAETPTPVVEAAVEAAPIGRLATVLRPLPGSGRTVAGRCHLRPTTANKSVPRLLP